MRETLKALHDDLEDMTTHRPAWKKDRHILTPDIDTQVTPLGLAIVCTLITYVCNEHRHTTDPPGLSHRYVPVMS